jgi:DNA-directed RNA polymerase subunit RPC12/RpoP
MGSARTRCPECHSSTSVVDLADLLHSPTSDYFRCRECGSWWIVPKGTDEPATALVLGSPAAPLNLKVS